MTPEGGYWLVVTSVVSIVGSWIATRGTRTNTAAATKLPPYEALAKRVVELEHRAEAQDVRLQEEKAKVDEIEDNFEEEEARWRLERKDLCDRMTKVEERLARDRDWIMNVIPVMVEKAPEILARWPPPPWYPDGGT